MIGRFITQLPMDDPSEMRVSSKQSYVTSSTAASQSSTSKDSEEGRRVLSIYTSPFPDECRAFARLQSRGEKGTWAVKCHGWIKLSDDQYRRISGRYGFPLSRWAIVKDDRPNPVQLSDVPEIVRKKDIAHQALMYDSNMLPRNFRGSFLVDLGSTKTYTYPLYGRTGLRAGL